MLLSPTQEALIAGSPRGNGDQVLPHHDRLADCKRRICGLKRRFWWLVFGLAVTATGFLYYSYSTVHQEDDIGLEKLPTYDGFSVSPVEELPVIEEDSLAINLSVPRLCSDLPIPETFWDATMDGLPAFVDIPQASSISLGDSVCIRVVVPTKASNSSKSFAPFPNTPWDSVLLDLVGNYTGISVPVALQMSNNAQNYIRRSVHIYEADVVLRDVDTFIPAGYIEYRDALWNGEDHTEVQPMVPEQLAISPDAHVAVTDDSSSTYSMANYLSLPLCTEPDADGRWVYVDDLPFNASLALPPDNTNRVWLPYDCRLQRYSYQEFAQCLQQKYPLVHWFGDSNTRRALKKITTLGRWCSKPEEIDTQMCICNDNAQGLGMFDKSAPFFPIDIDPVNGGKSPLSDKHLDVPPANSSRIIMFPWGGLTTLNSPPWTSTFSASHAKRGTPSVAIFALINWDAAFSSRSFFVQEVEKLLGHVAQSYPASTDIVIRTGQYYCCAYDGGSKLRRKYSRLRNQYFSQYLVDAFNERFGAERNVGIWDVGRISERRTYAAREDAAKRCPPNHVRPEVIDTENIVLANHLCNSLSF